MGCKQNKMADPSKDERPRHNGSLKSNNKGLNEK